MKERSEEEKRLESELRQTKAAFEILDKNHTECQRAVAVLMAAGFLTQEKWEQALEISRWR